MQKAKTRPDQGEMVAAGVAEVAPTKYKAPTVISIERAGWRVMLKSPGTPAVEIGTDVDKVVAGRVAVNRAETRADDLGETVEVHTHDAKGRHTATRYIHPNPAAQTAEGGK